MKLIFHCISSINKVRISPSPHLKNRKVCHSNDWRVKRSCLSLRRLLKSRSEAIMSISITQEQAAVLLPLLPRLVAQVPAPIDGTCSEEQTPRKMKESFSTTEMLTNKKKNLKATAALPISKLFIVNRKFVGMLFIQEQDKTQIFVYS